MKRILISGASSYLGYNLVKYLKENYEDLYIVGFDFERPMWHHNLFDKYFIRNIIAERYNNDVFLEPYDEIYQFAGTVGNYTYRLKDTNSYELYTKNILINQVILNNLIKRSYFDTKILYASSSEVYSPSFNDIKDFSENNIYPVNVTSNLGFANIVIEKMYYEYYKKYGINIKIARYFNVYGPRSIWVGNDEQEIIIYKIIQTLLKKNPKKSIEIFGEGTQIRNYLHIDDAVEMTKILMDSNIISPVNICHNESYTIHEYAKILMDIFEDHRDILKVKADPQYSKIGNYHLFKNLFNYKYKYNVIYGMANTITWIKKQYKALRSNKGVFKKYANRFKISEEFKND